jgi:thioesterase domain-containing protein/acyl carrier protein
MTGSGEGFLAAPTPTQHHLAGIWCQALERSQVGVGESFFGLGGDSIAAAQVLAEIQKAFGLRLPLTVFLTDPTVEVLAAMIDRQTEAPRSLLVPLQPQGSRPPFFCVHGVGGAPLCLRELARLFPLDQPFYAFRSASAQGYEQPCASIQGMASRYLGEVRTLQRDGPYYLGGFSFGGSVALEMAQQLRALGEEVGLLAILDHTPPPLRYRRFICTPTLPIDFAVNAVRWLLEDIWRAGPGRRLAALRRKVCDAWRQMVNAALRPKSARTDTDAVFGGRSIPDEFRQLVETHYRALRAYKPEVYPGVVTLLKARVRPLFRLHGKDLGWSGLAGGGLDVVEIPGNHETMLTEPKVRTLAEALLARLRAAQAKDSGRPS